MLPALRPRAVVVGCLVAALSSSVAAQQPPATQPRPAPSSTTTRPAGQGAPTTPAAPGRQPGTGASTGMPIPSDYAIGPDDVLGIVVWRETELSGDVTVRPDGMITLPLLQDVKAVGLTPDQLRGQLQQAFSKFVADPNVTVTVRQIHSRNVFITGEVARPGPYPLSGQMNVLQLITVAGGLTEYADRGSITILRTDGGKPQSFKFNYSDVSKGKNVAQNIVLKPGDQVVVP